MPRSKTAWAALAAILVAIRVSAAADKAALDAAFAQLLAYDFGRDSAPTTAIANLVTASYGKPADRKELASRLAEVLKSAAPRGAKDFACRQLAVIGTADEAPALAPLLLDEHLSHMARYALERIPGPTAEEAMRQALGKVQGKLLVGVINSLGNRRVVGAVEDLARLISSDDPAVGQAAAAALGKMGLAARVPLEQALARAPAPVRPAVAQALLLCAEDFAGRGNRDEAVALYDRLAKTDSPSVRTAAARGAVLAREAAGPPLLAAYLEDSDPDLLRAALALARETPGEAATKAIASTLDRLAAEKRILVLEALADRGDRAAIPAVLAQVQRGEKNVRVAAIRALARLGDASTVPLLMELAAADDPDVAQAAAAALANLPGKDADAAVQGFLGHGNAQVRRAAIEILGQRRAVAAAPALLQAAADADESIRLAAMKALGETAGREVLPGMVGLLLKASSEKERAAMEAALAAAIGRAPDRDACVALIGPAITSANAEAKASLLRTLGRLGGAEALKAVQGAIQDPAESVRETAIRILAEWPDPTATSNLASLARNSQSKPHKILALRGYIRLIAQHPSMDQKLAACKEALSLAERDDERKLVLGVLGGVPHVEALAAVLPLLAQPATREEAAAAAVAIAEKIVGHHAPEAAAAMKQVLATTANPELQRRAKEVLRRAEGK
jgi:HEAT repeat protein